MKKTAGLLLILLVLVLSSGCMITFSVKDHPEEKTENRQTEDTSESAAEDKTPEEKTEAAPPEDTVEENTSVEDTEAENTERIQEDVSEVTTEATTETKNRDNRKEEKDQAFYITKITDDIFARIEGRSFKDDCTLPRKDLRYLHVLHKDINGEEHEGEMIVNYHIAEDVLEILKELYVNDYPIEKIRLVDEYDADDELSMEDNNSSCFNYRFVSHTTKVSKHGLGLAVDINTLYNPYVKTVNGKRSIEPVNAEPYLDRDADFDYKIEKGDLCYNLFTEHGFEWGGNWVNSKDYQHFQIPTEKVEEWYP